MDGEAGMALIGLMVRTIGDMAGIGDTPNTIAITPFMESPETLQEPIIPPTWADQGIRVTVGEAILLSNRMEQGFPPVAVLLPTVEVL